MKDTLFILENTPVREMKFSSGKVFKKELIYTDVFQKDGERFAIQESDLDTWIMNFEAMQEVGVGLPLQAEHDTSPDANRGEVVALEKGYNEKGLPALYGYISFSSPEYEEMASAVQVSIFSVSDFTDGKGNHYQNCLRHVALTIEPVVPALEQFTEIAASLACKDPKKKDKSMSKIKELAQKLDLSLSKEEEESEDMAFDKVLAYVGKISKELSDLKVALAGGKKEGEEEEGGEKKPPMPPKEGEETPPKEGEEEEEKKEEAAIAASFVKRFSNQEAELRKTRILSLLQDGRITKAVADDLEKQFCEPKTLALSFDKKGDGEFKDGFDATVSALGKNDRVLSFNERTGPQGFGGNEAKPSPLVADAEARAKAYGQ